MVTWSSTCFDVLQWFIWALRNKLRATGIRQPFQQTTQSWHQPIDLKKSEINGHFLQVYMPQTVVLPTSQAKNFDALPAFLDANLRGKPRQYPHGEYLSRPLTKANFQTNLVEGEGVSRHQKELYEAGPDEAIDKTWQSYSVVEGGKMLQEALGGLFWSYFREKLRRLEVFFRKEGLDEAIDEGSKEGGRKKHGKRMGALSKGGRTKGGALTNLGLRLGPSVTFRSYSLGLPLTMKSFTCEQPPTHSPRERAVEAWRCNTHLRLRWSCYFHLEAGVAKTCGMSAEIREPSVVLTSLQITVESLIVFVVTIDF